MTLHPFLCLSVLFCALVMVVSNRGGGSTADKLVPGALLALELFLLLLWKDIVHAPFLSDRDARVAGSSLVALLAAVEFMRKEDKAFPLLAFYAALVQLLVALSVITGVSG